MGAISSILYSQTILSLFVSVTGIHNIIGINKGGMPKGVESQGKGMMTTQILICNLLEKASGPSLGRLRDRTRANGLKPQERRHQP